MKYSLVILAIVCSVLLVSSGCGQIDNTYVYITPDATFDLGIGKTAIIKETDLRIKFDSVINDSRCPTGVSCIWAGEAKCKILVTQNNRTDEVILTQTGDSEGSGHIGEFSVRFFLFPYPRSTASISPNSYSLNMILSR